MRCLSLFAVSALAASLAAGCAAPAEEETTPGAQEGELNAGPAREIGRGPARDVVDLEVAAVALDRQGRAHIALLNDAYDLEVLVEQADGSLRRDVVDQSGQVGEHATIALDDAGNEHIAYYDRTNNSVAVSRRGSDGRFVKDLVGPGSSPSIVVQGTTEHVAWSARSGTGDLVRYASRPAGGTWSAAVDVAASGGYPSLAVSAASVPSVAYDVEVSADADEIRVATKDASGFTSIVVDSGLRYSPPRIALAPTGEAHLAYSAVVRRNGPYTTTEVRHAKRDGAGAWSAPQSVGIGDGYSVALSVDRAGVVHIVSSGNSSDGIEEALGRPGQPFTAERTPYRGRRPSIDVDANGKTALVYRSAYGSMFYYARER